MTLTEKLQTNSHFATAAGRTPARAKPTILVAEDSIDSREMMQVLLESKGYAVLAADDGVHAQELALKSHPNLILIDLQLPRLDGLSVTRNLRLHKELNDVPIIVLSGHDPSRYRQAALDAGCDDYLLKPLDFDLLDSLLHKSVPVVRALSARR